MTKKTNKWLQLTFLVALAVSSIFYATGFADDINKPAIFRVTTDIVNKDVQPFTATISSLGNTLINTGSGFEPIVFRNKFIAQKNSPDRIYIERNSLTHYDTYREGYLDEARVYIYRIENGHFKMVREDTVAPGGTHASGWIPVTKSNSIITATSTRFHYRWADWNRPKAAWYFTVRAIDKYGNLSEPAPVFKIQNPGIKNKSKGKANQTIKFKPSKSFFNRPIPPPSPDALTGRLQKDGSLTLEWEPVNADNLAGYILYKSDYPPQEHTGYYLLLGKTSESKNKPVKKGDMIIVSKKLYASSRNRLLTNRVWGANGARKSITAGLIKFYPDEDSQKTWKLVQHKQATPVEQPGETFLELDLKDNTKQKLGLYNHSGTEQSWYDVLEKKTYKVEVWLRQEGNGSVQFEMTGSYNKQEKKFKPIIFNVDNTWKKYTATFTPDIILKGKRVHTMSLAFTGPSKFQVDNFRVYRADTPYLELLPREMNAVKSSNLSFLRTHGLTKTGNKTYDITQLTNPGGVISGTQKLNTLPQLFKIMRTTDTNPWLQIEYHLSPEEWLGFIEYIAAPYDPAIDTPEKKPWAYKRYQQGQKKPWVTEFNKIFLELSNETWNRIMRPWVFTAMLDATTNKKYSAGQVYGMYQEYVISLLKSSPYWKSANLEEKISFILGGWSAHNKFGLDAAAASPSSDSLAVAAYNGGWDENEGPPKLDQTSLVNVLAQVNQGAIPVADKHMEAIKKLQNNRSRKLLMSTYEAGPGYALNGLNKARVSKDQAHQQELVMKSLAAGTATIDAFLARAYRGYTYQNFFTFNDGDYWKSHAKWYYGGHAYPSWKMISLFNNQATGDMLRTETLSVPVASLKAYKRRKAVKNAPLVAVYATRKNSRYSLFIVSRKIPGYPSSNDDGYTPVEIDLPFNKANKITLYRMTGKPEENNVNAENVKIEKIDNPESKTGRRFIVNAETGADARGLPPASTFLYVFDDVNKVSKSYQ